MPLIWLIVFIFSYWIFIQYSNKKQYSRLVKWGGGYLFASIIALSIIGILSFPEQEREKQRLVTQQAEQRKRQAEQAKIKAEAEDARKRAEEETCKIDLQCWGDKHLLTATIHCQDLVEKLAKYDFQWTDGWTEAKFSRFKWHDLTAKTMTYIGDKIKFQNGFGAWQYIVYQCDYDTLGQKVIDVRAFPGRL